MFDSTVAEPGVSYQLGPGPAAVGQAVGSTAHAGLTSFLGFVRRVGVEHALADAGRRPVQERRSRRAPSNRSTRPARRSQAGSARPPPPSSSRGGKPSCCTPCWPRTCSTGGNAARCCQGAGGRISACANWSTGWSPGRPASTAAGGRALLLPPTHPDARRLVPTAHGWQLRLPFDHLVFYDAHF